MAQTSGKRDGPGLKPGLNSADTGSVVDTVKGHRAAGRSSACTPTGAGKASNNMVAANASRKR